VLCLSTICSISPVNTSLSLLSSSPNQRLASSSANQSANNLSPSSLNNKPTADNSLSLSAAKIFGGSPPSNPTKIAPTNPNERSPLPISSAVQFTHSGPVNTPGKSQEPIGAPVVEANGTIKYPGTDPCANGNSNCAHRWDIILYSQDANDYGGTFVAQPNNINGWGCGAFLCTGTSNAVIMEPMNIDLGSAGGSQTWFQFDIEFDQNCGLGICGNAVNCFCIWNNTGGAACSNVTYNEGNIQSSSAYTPGLPYTPGDAYEWHFYPTTTPDQVAFLIKDDTSGQIWFNYYTVPSTNLIYGTNCYSPAAGIETYIDNSSTTALTNFPEFQFYEGNDLHTITGVGGVSTIFGSSSLFYITCDFCFKSTGPSDGFALGLDQSFIENQNSGLWYWTTFQSYDEVQANITLKNDSLTTPINTTNDFQVQYTQNGCFECYVVNYFSDMNSTLSDIACRCLILPSDSGANVNVLGASTSSGRVPGELWCTNAYCSNSGISFSSYKNDPGAFLYYYELWLEQPFMNVIGGGTPSPNPTFSFETAPSKGIFDVGDSPNLTSITLLNVPQPIFVLPRSGVGYTSCVPIIFSGGMYSCGTLNPAERWSTGGPCQYETINHEQVFVCQTNSVASGINEITNINYYHEYLVMAAYTVNDGGTPITPTLNSTQAGFNYETQLTTTLTGYWLNAGAMYSVTSSLQGSTSTQRWEIASGEGSGTVTITLTVNFAYYHQYLTTFKYHVVGGGSPNPPTVTFDQFASISTLKATTAGAKAWVNSGSSYSYTNPLTGSNSTERWQAKAPSGTVTKSLTINPSYYDQFLVMFEYKVVGGGTPSAPTAKFTEFGSSASVTAGVGSVGWVDNGSIYTYTNPLVGSNSSQRWFTSSASGVIKSSTTIDPTYNRQYFVTFVASPSSDGTVSPSSNWFNSGSTITIKATANSGFTFSKWTTSTKNVVITNSKLATTTAKINGFGTITADFT
jgi:hypothetical protein